MTEQQIIEKDYNYYLKKVKKGWYGELEHIPNEFKTYELCLIAVRKHGWALKFVPEEFKTEEMCLAAINENCCARQWATSEFQTEEFWIESIERAGVAIQYVPKEFRTYEVCLKAVQQIGWALQFIPEEFKTEEMCLAAFNVNCEALSYMPSKFKTKELYLAALQRNNAYVDLIDPSILPISEWDIGWFKHLWNAELSRQFIKERGKEVWDQLFKLKTVDEDNEYKLIRFKYVRDQANFQKALVYQCPSSGDTYFTEIDPKITKINKALRFLNNNIKKEELAYES